MFSVDFSQDLLFHPTRPTFELIQKIIMAIILRKLYKGYANTLASRVFISQNIARKGSISETNQEHTVVPRLAFKF